MMDVTGYDKFYLNESIIITIMGQKDKDVSMIFRLD
jgi:hypothetical protein